MSSLYVRRSGAVRNKLIQIKNTKKRKEKCEDYHSYKRSPEDLLVFVRHVIY